MEEFPLTDINDQMKKIVDAAQSAPVKFTTDIESFVLIKAVDFNQFLQSLHSSTADITKRYGIPMQIENF
ncbi:hypothetical protein F3J37_01235 [Pantoea sp. Al-1710]|uniref:Prevent-host-death family protein n=1 Tax=Candidatus Pantoea communis TaxID=2608354 RepID=A0ABX0RI30_9GAMM|nr:MULTISPECIES: hypothetical protein [Pantoea]NIG12999.1 hypothetical protein [Pantoea sp. Cy-640]NIG17300.1 hypothetical protein [Pantoea communis]